MRLGVMDSGTIKQQLSDWWWEELLKQDITLHIMDYHCTHRAHRHCYPNYYFIAHTAHRHDVTNTNNTARMCKKIPPI